MILTHWGRVTHICVSKLTIIASDNGLSPGRRQAINWSNDGILLIWLLGTNLSEILIEIHSFSFKKMHLKMSSGKWRPFCLALNVLIAPKQTMCPSLPRRRVTRTYTLPFVSSATMISGFLKQLQHHKCVLDESSHSCISSKATIYGVFHKLTRYYVQLLKWIKCHYLH